MFLLENAILSKDDCKLLLESVTDFKEAELYYTTGVGVREKVIIPTQRKASKCEMELIKDSIIYDKLNSITKKAGYTLTTDKIKYQIVKYSVGDFIYKHRHDMDASMFLTIVIQLNDSSNYSGGDFLYWVNGTQFSLSRTIGDGILISSDVEHEVTMVTQGVRHSFVIFIEFSDVESLTKQSFI